MSCVRLGRESAAVPLAVTPEILRDACQLAGAGKCGLLFLECLRNLSFLWSVTLSVKCPRGTDHSCAFWKRPGGVPCAC